jgi:hypothetical protein
MVDLFESTAEQISGGLRFGPYSTVSVTAPTTVVGAPTIKVNNLTSVVSQFNTAANLALFSSTVANLQANALP